MFCFPHFRKNIVYSHQIQPPPSPPPPRIGSANALPIVLRPILPLIYLYPNQIAIYLGIVPSARCHFFLSVNNGSLAPEICPVFSS